ncbi:MAG: SGNH/GDSL hydrolase family protein, partial [Vallitaleaceae bacterium]|nr:SGNH/GDSL hydrolase family protein [Vallitaleaceae bacterium]
KGTYMADKQLTLLFQGDSVTDVGRERADGSDLGAGYVKMVAELINAELPSKNIQVLNRGISGDRLMDLRARWEEDCIALQPSIISILIGINDCWRRYDDNDPTDIDDFISNYRHLLQTVKSKTDAKIILCEPFVLPIPEDRIRWREDLDPKIKAIHMLGEEFDALIIPLDYIFKEVSKIHGLASLAEDGVHPTELGHSIIAKAWFEMAKELL